MKTIGMLGGMSWESTISYYKIINEVVRSELGGLNSAKILLNSLNFDEIAKLQQQGDWPEMTKILCDSARSLEVAGADFIVICTNTMHKIAPEIRESISIPLLHIADTTAIRLQTDGIKKVGLLGTRFTMQQDFYKQHLTKGFGIEVIVPNDEQQTKVHNIIYKELCQGVVKEESRACYQAIMADLHNRGAQAIILGCTEIAMLIEQIHVTVPIYDTTRIHATEAARLAIASSIAY
ncbi:aspartate/glutamate racemase family protein [Glaciecola sp. 1036]|uniref:aspartate/glutamate racemase family protein n=1 Tax=Alteromonadaceae TaxID=72275 RepID=UPI003D05A150